MPTHLTLLERDRLAQLRGQGYSQKEIAAELGRSPATISRELRRNSTEKNYFSGQAQFKARRRRCERPLRRIMDDPHFNEYVRHGLAQLWSPEQIVHRFQLDHPEKSPTCISAPTIYAWIKRDANRMHWQGFLRRRGKRPYRRKKPETSLSARIANRPEVIEERKRLGDFEGDTVLGPPNTGGIVTLVDRKSRLTIMTKIKSKHADHVLKRIRLRVKRLEKSKRRSITFDNGTEFAACERLEKPLEIALYYADPGCPYQRGTNENTNGLIRQFFPKGTEFNAISHQELRQAENLLNNRPRKCLQWRTPYEVHYAKSVVSDCD